MTSEFVISVEALVGKGKMFAAKTEKRWICLIDNGCDEPREFVRGGFMTRDQAQLWARNLGNDYPDAIEIIIRELTEGEMKQYRATGAWK